MIRAILFDFNGVIADDETPHFVCFQQALAESGLSITADQYYGTYLGMDERACTALLLTARDGACDAELAQRIAERKAQLFAECTAQHRPRLFRGVVEFVKQARERCRLAVASGGRRIQIDRALEGTAIQHDFEAIVSADDCAIGKPDPAIYQLTLQRLNARTPVGTALGPADCLVIEDSKAGIQAARAAGMTVLALSTTYPPSQLGDAHMVLPSLEGQRPESLLGRFPAPPTTRLAPH
jgi:beta-phosphoglucomutase